MLNIKTRSIQPEAKSFYKSLFTIVGPIALQNLFSAAVSSADVIMLGYVGQTAIAAASLASYVQFVLFLFFTGLSSGLIMLSSQYWGKKDTYSIETIFGITLKLACSVGLIFSLAAILFPKFLMLIFTNDTELIETGAQYLQIVGVSYFMLAISQAYQASLKSIEHVKIVSIVTIIALSLNIFLNAVFIFGFFGVPKSGIKGVAFATSISRFVEIIICLIASSRIKEVKLSFGTMFRKNKILLKDFFHYSLPALGNEFVWGAAFAMYAVILGHLGSDIVAANSVVNVIRNLATVLCFGMAYGGAILIGKEIGSNDLDKAKRDSSRLIKSTIASGIAGAVLMFCLKPLLPKIASLTPTAANYLNPLLYINCFSVIGASINTVIICGVFRAGGDSKFGFICDTIIMWAVSVPLGLLCAFVFKFPPVIIYFILYLDEWEKMAFVVYHYKSGKWLKNITREFK